MKEEEVSSRFADLCASYQLAAVDQLVKMTDHVLHLKSINPLDCRVELRIMKN